MFKWWTNYRQATKQTKYFIFTWIFYGALVIIAAAYSYARLDYVRTYPVSKSELKEESKEFIEKQAEKSP